MDFAVQFHISLTKQNFTAIH